MLFHLVKPPRDTHQLQPASHDESTQHGLVAETDLTIYAIIEVNYHYINEEEK